MHNHRKLNNTDIAKIGLSEIMNVELIKNDVGTHGSGKDIECGILRRRTLSYRQSNKKFENRYRHVREGGKLYFLIYLAKGRISQNTVLNQSEK